MKFKTKFLIFVLTFFISFVGTIKTNALEIKDIELNKTFSLLVDPNKPITSPGNEIPDSGGSTPGFKLPESNSASSWCENFNQVWYIFGLVIQVIYIVTPLLLIITGSITMIQAMTKKDESAITKAQSLLVKKIIVAVIIFLMVSITKMVIGLVADDGWTTCANCAFNPSQGNCGIDKVPTG